MSVTPERPGRVAPGRTRALGLATVLAAGFAGFGAVYVMAGGADNGTSPPVRVAQIAPAAGTPLPKGPGSNPLSVGTMAAFVFRKAPESIPSLPFQDAKGQSHTLDEWKGKVVLLNLWATWCAPCRKEMPSLDRLQSSLGSKQFEVVAVSADRAGVAGAARFLGEIKVQGLAVYADPSVRIHSGLKAIGMPTTLLLDREGREIGRLVGPAEWDSPEAKALIVAALAAGKG